MSDEIALIAACVADPTDDTRRLALADFYDENPTDDRRTARSEWIRLTCSGASQPKFRRQAGEPKWIKENAQRLWPTWASAVGRNPARKLLYDLQLLSGCAMLRYPVRFKTRNGFGASVAALKGGRGVIHTAVVSFCRGGAVAPLVAADEPHARIVFDLIPQAAFAYDYTRGGSADGTVRLFSRPFELAGMEGVWDFIVGYTDEYKSNGAGWCKVFNRELHKEPQKIAVSVTNRALTRWARAKAGVPDFGPLPQPLPATADEPVAVPQKIT